MIYAYNTHRVSVPGTLYNANLCDSTLVRHSCAMVAGATPFAVGSRHLKVNTSESLQYIACCLEYSCLLQHARLVLYALSVVLTTAHNNGRNLYR